MANKRKAEEALGVASGSTAASRGSTGPGAREKGATRPEITITATDIFGPSPVRPPASKKKKTKPKRKTLTTKGRRAVVYNVLATVEANKVARPSVASNGTSTVAGAPAQPPPPDHSQEDVRNLGKAWSKADLTKLARLSEDPDFLRQTIPEHAGGADLDWECISRHFGRWSRGGTAVKHQFYSVVRLMKVSAVKAVRMCWLFVHPV